MAERLTEIPEPLQELIRAVAMHTVELTAAMYSCVDAALVDRASIAGIATSDWVQMGLNGWDDADALRAVVRAMQPPV